MDNLKRVRDTIAALKHPQDFEAIPELPVRQQDQVGGFLRAVPSELKGMASADARLMAAWRNSQDSVLYLGHFNGGINGALAHQGLCPR